METCAWRRCEPLFHNSTARRLIATAGSSAAADTALVFGEAIGLFGLKDEYDAAGFLLNVGHGVLNGRFDAEFDFDGQIEGAQDRGRHFDDFGELACMQTMVEVACRPGLQQAGRGMAARTAAIDEVFVDSADFRHVKVIWNQLAGRELKADRGVAGGT
jgi:hypothetical protein